MAALFWYSVICPGCALEGARVCCRSALYKENHPLHSGLYIRKKTRAEEMAGWTGLEPATSGVTGRRSNRAELPPHGAW
jgi:hypothetical protein